MSATKIVSFRTSKENKERIEKLAKETKRSSAFFYNELLDRYLEDLEDIYIAEKRLEDLRSGKQTTISAETIFKKENKWQ